MARKKKSTEEPIIDSDSVLVEKQSSGRKKKYEVVLVINPTTIMVKLEQGGNWKVRNYKGKTPNIGDMVEI